MTDDEDDDKTPTRHRVPRARSYPQGVAPLGVLSGVPLPDDYGNAIDTGVYELFDRDPSDEEVEIVRRTRRKSNAPLTVEDGAKLLRYIRKQAVKSEESGIKRQIAHLEDVLSRPTRAQTDAITTELSGLREAVAGMKPDVDTVRAIKRRFLAWLGIGSLTTLTAIGIWLYARGGYETEMRMRLEAVERNVERLTRYEEHSSSSRTP